MTNRDGLQIAEYDITASQTSLSLHICLQYMQKIRAKDIWFLLFLSVIKAHMRFGVITTLKANRNQFYIAVSSSSPYFGKDVLINFFCLFPLVQKIVLNLFKIHF